MSLSYADWDYFELQSVCPFLKKKVGGATCVLAQLRLDPTAPPKSTRGLRAREGADFVGNGVLTRTSLGADPR